MKQQALIFDYSLGELDPKLRGRFDLPIYQHGASYMSNAVPYPQGGFVNRPGTVYLGTAKNAAAVRLIPFIMTTASYLFEFGVNYIRVWKDKELVQSGDAWAALTAYTTGEEVLTDLGVFEVTTGGTSGSSEPTWDIANPVSDGTVTWEYHSASSPLELTTTYSASELPDLQFAQDATRLVITHQNHAPAIITVLADTYTFATMSYRYNGTAAGAYDFFNGAGNYPRACAFHESRLIFAGTINHPGGIWATRPYVERTVSSTTLIDFVVYDTVSYSITQLTNPSGWDKDANGIPIAETETVTTTRDIITQENAYSLEVDDVILWLASSRDLIVGCQRGERIIPAGSVPPLVPCQKHTALGSTALQPFLLNGAIMFAEASCEAIREYQYQDTGAAYNAPALTFFSSHILDGGISDMDYQNNPLQILWTVKKDGTLAGCVYEKAQNVTAWFRLSITGALIESIAVIPGTTTDDLYLAINRSGTRSIEYLGPMDMTLGHLDSSVVKTKPAGTTKVTGIAWLNGTASVVYNGLRYTVTVTAGEVSLASITAIPEGASVIIGKPFTMRVSSMPLAGQAKIGSSHMRQGNTPLLILKVLASYPFQAGNVLTQLETATFTGKATDDIKVALQSQWATENIVHIVQDTSQDLTVLALQAEIDAGG